MLFVATSFTINYHLTIDNNGHTKKQDNIVNSYINAIVHDKEELRRRALVTIVMYWNESFMAKYRSTFIKTRCNILFLLHLVT